jgi:hypothetical protein
MIDLSNVANRASPLTLTVLPLGHDLTHSRTGSRRSFSALSASWAACSTSTISGVRRHPATLGLPELSDDHPRRLVHARRT